MDQVRQHALERFRHEVGRGVYTLGPAAHKGRTSVVMRRRTLVTTVIVACAFAAAIFLVLREAGRRSAEEAEPIPLHYFIPSASPGGDVLLCDLTWKAKRAPAAGRWEQPLQPCSLGEGWARPTSGGRRAYGPSSELIFQMERTDWSQLIVTARSTLLDENVRGRDIRVTVNGRTLGTRTLPERWEPVVFEIPPGTLEPGPNKLAFSSGDGDLKEPTKGTRRSRPITARIREVAVCRSLGEKSSLAALRSLLRRAKNRPAPPPPVHDPTSGRFVLTAPGRLVLPIQPAAGARALVVEAKATAGLDRNSTRLRLLIEDLSTGAVRSESLRIGGRWSILGLGKARSKIPIEDFAGDPCLLTFEAVPEPAGASIEIAPPRVVPKAPKEPRSSQARSLGAGPPDIVWITLDAARADHFSCYGYPRPTTPNIDRLAAESLVFTRVFALAPYTLCSVPTMVTGLSFFDHQVVSHENVLCEEAVTLAEQLKAFGYRTACFSCSPNNSRDLGTSQGYDEFYELWTEVPREESRIPTYLADRVVRWLAENDRPEPLHLQLHFVPPHSPYTPAPEFDVFTDPSYDGPCDGTNETIAALDSGRLQPSQEDLQHVIDLYDGNLLAADSAVGQVLAALATRPRWDHTVVLITADHGDAFLEHGRTGHNSTVYDEMLHVPFILRLPRTHDASAVDVNRLATLADLVPTLLTTVPAWANIPPHGVDLLAPDDRNLGRFIVARTTSTFPILGLRTERWKLILTDWGHGELYDLREDPGEHHDLALVNRPVFVALAQMLTERAAQPPLLDAATRASEMSEADRKMLEALGYTE